MDILYWIGQGIVSIIGIALGMVVCLIVVMYAIRSRPTTYQPNELLKGFETYRHQLEYEQQFEKIRAVDIIIKELKEGIVILKIKNYTMTRAIGIRFGQYDDSSTKLDLICEYKIWSEKSE